jgi:hypothetical protein
MLVRAKIALTFFDASTKRYAHGVAFTQYTSSDHEKITAFVASKQPTT